MGAETTGFLGQSATYKSYTWWPIYGTGSYKPII